MYRLATPNGHVRGRLPGGNISYKIENGVVRLDSEEVPEFWTEIDAKELVAKKHKRQDGTICININTVGSTIDGDATGYTSSRVTMMKEDEFREVAGLMINNDVMIVDDASNSGVWTSLLKHLGTQLRETGVHNEIAGPYSKLLILNLKHPAFGV
tara:strand:- start:199 stop:663 length:465 start_codon:yes stop_codon:yes gene_type:complete